MGLGLPVARLSGRQQKSAGAVVLGELEEADLLAGLEIPEGQRPTSRAPRVGALRARHHELARLLAQGRKPGEVARLAGYDVARIAILQADPTFAGLVEFYQQQALEAFKDLAARAATLSLTAAEVLQDRLEDEPDRLTNGQLLEIFTAGTDRLGLAPAAKASQQVNIFTGETLEAIKAAAGDQNVITLTRTAGGAPQEYRAPPESLLLEHVGAGLEESEAKGGEGSRADLREEGGGGT